MSHKLKEDDPVYYKCALRGLLTAAQENGIKVGYRMIGDQCYVGFENDIGERSEVVIKN